jgi:excisionase family DNA binding protein
VVLAKHIKAIPLRQKPLLSIEEAAEMLGVGRSSLYRSIQRGDLPLPLFRINCRYWVARRAVEFLIDGGEPQPVGPVDRLTGSDRRPRNESPHHVEVETVSGAPVRSRSAAAIVAASTRSRHRSA